MSVEPSRSVVVWLDPEQTGLVRSIVERLDLTVVGAGSGQVGRSNEVAAALGGRPLDDLRAAVSSEDAGLFLLAAPGDFGGGLTAAGGAGAADDGAALAACRARGSRIVSLEPMPASVLGIDALTMGTPLVESFGGVEGEAPSPGGGTALPGGWATFCPLARAARPLRDAADVLTQLGQLHTLSVEAWGAPAHGSLGARLYDATELIVSLMGRPEAVHAAYVWPSRKAPLHPVPGETLRGVHGSVVASLRFADGRAASIAASDGGGRWERSVTVLGENGRVKIDEGGFVWVGADGRVVDSSRSAPFGPDEDPAAGVIAETLGRLLDPRIPPPSPTDTLGVLATASAALLSARTGEAESPDTILRMARSG